MKKKPVRQRTLAPLSSAHKRAAFNDMADAIGKYLKTIGWTAVVVGNPRIQDPPGWNVNAPGARLGSFEFVVKFTGGKIK